MNPHRSVDADRDGPRSGHSVDGGRGNASPPPPVRRWQIPPLDPDDRLLTGVAAAVSRELGVDAMAVRAAFVIAALSGGWGLVAYGLAWALMSRSNLTTDSYLPQPKAASVSQRYAALGLIVIGATLLVGALDFWFIDWIVLPSGFVLVGALIAWSRGRDGDDGIPATLRILAGVVVATAGMITMVVLNFSTTGTLQVLTVAAAILAGVALIVGPSLFRIGSELDDERQERARADERAQLAAHLHDSVLQTLMLIQKHAQDPDRTARIARQQERDLRSWLYDPKARLPGTRRLGPALEQAAGGIEQNHGVRIEIITVGDNNDLDPRIVDGLTSAAAEAMTNAAKHAGTDTVDVYAERSDSTIEVFIRDNGVGFEPDEVPTDRLGLRESIVGRLERLGGTARIESEVGSGTEVELVLPCAAGTTETAPHHDANPASTDNTQTRSDA